MRIQLSSPKKIVEWEQIQIARLQAMWNHSEQELGILSTLAIGLIGKTPEQQRSLVEFRYCKYLTQNEFPNLRDVTKAILEYNK